MTAPARILVVDACAEARSNVVRSLKRAGFTVATAENGSDALEQLEAFEPDLILTELGLPGMSGIELLQEVRALGSSCLVIVTSAERDVEPAVEAMTAGASDYLTRPFGPEDLVRAVRGAFERRSLESVKRHMALTLAMRAHPGALVGASVQSQEVLHAVTQVAPTDATVLLIGESGTGKDLVASTIHARSRHAQGAFVKVHCGMLEDEHHERDASPTEPTPPDTMTWLAERFAQASGGTLYLDAVDELSPAAQSRLGRALQAHEARREGDGRRITTDARIIAAARRELGELCATGAFREDLYYRLSVVTIRLPPLRYRPADIPSLSMHFLLQFARQMDKRVRRISPAALDALTSHTWPGNVRELENTIERAVVLTNDDTIDVKDLPPDVIGSPSEVRAPSIPGASLAEIERYAILKTLEAQEGKVTRAARVLGVSPRTIQAKLRQYGAPAATRSH